MSLWRRAGGLRFAGIAVLVALLLRALQLLLVALLTNEDERAVDRLLIWDGGWFINVATHGYPDGYTYDNDGVQIGNGFAFFPLFPLLVRAVAALGIPPGDASLLVAGVAALVAALLVYLLGVAVWSRPVGMMLMVLVCAQPMAVVLNMGYTESLFLALVAGTLLAAYQRLWWLAALTGIAAGLTRPTGVAVGLALATSAYLLWRSHRKSTAPAAAALSTGAGGSSAATVGAAVGVTAGAGAAQAAEIEPGAGAAPGGPARGALARGTGEWRVLGATTPAQGTSPEARGALTRGTGEWRVLSALGETVPGEGLERGGLLSLAAERTGTGAAARVIATGKANFASKGPVTKWELVQAVAAAVLTLLAGPAFVLWVGWRVGEWDAWFKIQAAGWGSIFDGGASVASFLWETLREGTGMVEMVTAWLILGTIVLCLLAIVERGWPPLVVYGLVALLLALGQAGYWHSKPRLLVPVLLLASVPVARALAAAPRRTAIAVLALWSAFGLWFGAHMISIWPFTI